MGKFRNKSNQLDMKSRYELEMILDFITTSDYPNASSSSDDDHFDN